MNDNDQSVASKLVLGLGALLVFGYSFATVSDLLYGGTREAILWVALLVVGLAFVVLAATVTHRASRR